MTQKVKRLHDIVEGTKTAVKVDKATAARYKASGFFVFGNRVVVSKDKNEIGLIDKLSGLVLLQRLGTRVPFEKVVMPYSVQNIDQFLAECAKSPPDPQIFGAKKNPQDHWAFTFYGNNSLSTFADLGLMGEYLTRYISLQDDPRSFQHLILYRVVPSFWTASTYRNQANRKREGRRKWAKDRKDERRKENNKALKLRGREVMQAKQETYEQQNARHQREWYERQKAKLAADKTAADSKRQEWAARKKAQRAAKKGK